MAHSFVDLTLDELVAEGLVDLRPRSISLPLKDEVR
jgi:hypothetical protein